MTPTFQHRPPYSLSGEAGRALGIARIRVAEGGVTAFPLELRSMAADTLRISQTDGTAPEYLQAVSLWDADGRRVFTGVCTDNDEQWDGKKTTTVSTISGPWWWLDQVQLTRILADDAGDTQERAIYTFPAQDLALSIRALLDRLTEMGVPIRAGEIDTTFPVPQMQFQNGTAESILTTLLQWLPDCATSMRYDTGGLPMLDVRRRPTAPHVTYDLSSGNNRCGIPRIAEQRQLVPSQVRVQTMEVDASGQIVYGEEVAGDPAPATPLGRQILALSGPGRSDFQSYTPRVASLQTATIPAGPTGDVWTLAKTLDSFISDAEATNGAVTWTGYSDRGAFPSLPNTLAGAGAYRLISGTVLEWLTTEFSIEEDQTRIAGWIKGEYPSGGFTGATTYLKDQGRAFTIFSGGYYQMAIYVDFTVPTINNSYPSLTVFVHPEDQALVTPVPNLAANLYAAQKSIPVTGSIPLYPGAAMPLPGTRINIRGGLPKWQTMGAMSAGLSLDLRTGSAEATIGRASRVATSSLLNQFSRPLSGKIIQA